MLPVLKNGDTVLTDPRVEISVGDIVAANHPYIQSIKLIKRVQSINADGRYVLIGDNPEASTDSRHFGTIARCDLAGKVICLIENRFVSEFLAHRP